MGRIFRTKIGINIFSVAVGALFCMGLFNRCANPLAPEGGPRDTLPPRVVNMTPVFGQTNFDAKKVYIEFDEYIKLQNQSQEFYTSPFMKRKPTLLMRGRGVEITLYDTLQPNTTYSLNFGSSIQDNNEGNPLNSFRYVFSTGDLVDSMVMSGYTVDAYQKDSVSKAFILFYEASKDSVPDYDSTVFNAVADVVARAENNGIFVAENLKPIAYRVYAMLDNNNNQRYEPGTDDIGFLEGTYNPAEMPGFNVWYDTTRKYVVADPQLYFRLFRDEPFRRQYLAGQARPIQHKAIINFGAHYPEILSLYFEGIDSSRIVTEYLKPTRDSIAYWFNLPAEQLPDTIKGEITFMKHDSLNNMVPETAHLNLSWRRFATERQRRDWEREQQELEEQIRLGLEIPPVQNPFKFTVEAANTLNPEKHISFVFDYPLVEIDSSRISLIRIQEQSRFRVRYNIVQDSLNMRRWTITAPWVADQKYLLEIPAGALRNVAGESNDSLRSEFTVMNPEMYATLVFKVTGKTPESQYVLQLVDATGSRVISEIRHARTGDHTFRYVEPGNLRLRVLEDMNGNGEWDRGNLVQRLQPERVEMFVQSSGEQEIVAKTGWELEFEVDMNKVFAPVTMEALIEQLRQAEAERVRKYLEDRAKNPPREEQRRQPSSGSFGGFGGIGGSSGSNSATSAFGLAQ